HTRARWHLARSDAALPAFGAGAAGLLGSPLARGPLLTATSLVPERARARLAARRDFELAVAHEPKGGAGKRLAGNYFELGRLRYEAGEYEAALAAFDAALRAHPDFFFAHAQRAQALLALERDAEAGQALDRYLQKGTPLPEDYLARGVISFNL